MSDIVIIGAKRTAIGSMLGQFTGVPTPTLGATAMQAAIAESGISGDSIDEVIMGCVLPANLGQAPARQASRPDQGRIGQGRRCRRHGVDDQCAAYGQRSHGYPLWRRQVRRPHGLGRVDQPLRRPVDGCVRRSHGRQIRLHSRSSGRLYD